MSRSITVTWRTENYGRCSGCTTAFRLYDCVDFSDAEVAQVHEAAAQAGYSWDTSRCAWIAWTDDARAQLIAALQGFGYAVDHAGSWRRPEVAP